MTKELPLNDVYDFLVENGPSDLEKLSAHFTGYKSKHVQNQAAKLAKVSEDVEIIRTDHRPVVYRIRPPMTGLDAIYKKRNPLPKVKTSRIISKGIWG
jgi:hypothetical protein